MRAGRTVTTAPAARFGQSERKGSVAPGKQGDFVVLEGDPRAEIRALARVRYTIREGKLIWNRK